MKYSSDTPYPPLYTPFKFISLRVAPALRDVRISSNAVTVAWATLLAATSVAIAHERAVLALILVLPAIFLDCLDGDLARCRNRPSVSGTLLEQLSHWIGNMGLMAGIGAAVLLADPRPGNVLLVSIFAVVQAVYIAVVRQLRPDTADIPEHPRLRRAFTWIVKVIWNLSPIELPVVVALVAFGINEHVVLVVTSALVVMTVLAFVPHFLLVRASDRRKWAAASQRRHGPFADPSIEHAEEILARFPEAQWWTPGAPALPPGVLTYLSRQPMASDAPVLASVRRDLDMCLPELFLTSGRALVLPGPVALAMEAVVGTYFRSGDEILVVGGRTTIRRWRAVAERLRVQVIPLEVPFGANPACSAIESVLVENPDVRAVCLPLSQAEDGTLTDLPGLARVLRSTPALIVVDACLGLCADELWMDEWGIDIAVSSSDSGVMAPPGLSLIALGGRALRVLEDSSTDSARAGTYLDLRTHLEGGDHARAGLPAPAVGGLHLSVRMILHTGLDTLIEHRREVARRLRRGIEDAGLKLATSHPSAACTAAVLPDNVDLAELQRTLFAGNRIVVTSGATRDGAATLQFGHSGWVIDDDVDQAIKALTRAVRTARIDESGG